MGNILDLLCISNPDCLSDWTIIDPGLSDHFMIAAKLFITTKCHEIRPKIVKQYWKADSVAIKESLEGLLGKINHEIMLRKPMNEIWTLFEGGLKETVDLYVPVKTLPVPKASEPPWFNARARSMVTKQRKLYNKYKSTGLDYYQKAYKALRKENKKKFRQLESDYLYHVLYEPLQKGNTKPFYSHVKKLRGNCNKISNIETESGLVDSPIDVANVLNDYFHSVFGSDSNVVGGNWDLDDRWSMKIERDGVRALLLNLKSGKAPGPDGLRKVDLTLNLEIIPDILTEIF